MSSVVYWLHLPEHTDMFTQGYIGISNNVKKRFEDHKNRPSNAYLKNAIAKYGWDKLIKQIVIIADEAYCLAMELKLRVDNNIGWNLVAGGGKPPSSLGKKFIRSKEYKEKMSGSKMGHKHSPEVEAIIVKHLIENGKSTRFKKGEVQAINKIKHICPHCEKIGKGIAMKRWHLDNCKYKGNKNGIN